MTLRVTDDLEGQPGQAVVNGPGFVLGGNGAMVYTSAGVINGATAAKASGSGAARFLYYDLPAGTTGAWHVFYLTVPEATSAVVYYAALGNPGTKPVAEVGRNPDGTFRLRGEASRLVATSPAIPPGTQVRVAYRAVPGAPGGLQLRLYTGANVHGVAPDYDSGPQASQSTATTITEARQGLLYSPGVGLSHEVVFDRVRVDDAVEPAGSATAPSTPVLSAEAGVGAVALSWTQASNGGTAIGTVELTRATAATGPFVPVTPAPAAGALAYRDATVDNGTSYWYRLRTRNASTWSPLSNIVGPVTPEGVSGQEAAPNRDVTILGTTAEGAAVGGLWTTLDEPDPADDADFVRIARGGTYEVGLTPVTTPIPAGYDVELTYRLLEGHTGTLSVSLYSGSSLVVAGEPITDAAAGGTYTIVVPAAAVDRIVDGADLRVRLTDS